MRYLKKKTTKQQTSRSFDNTLHNNQLRNGSNINNYTNLKNDKNINLNNNNNMKTSTGIHEKEINLMCNNSNDCFTTGSIINDSYNNFHSDQNNIMNTNINNNDNILSIVDCNVINNINNNSFSNNNSNNNNNNSLSNNNFSNNLDNRNNLQDLFLTNFNWDEYELQSSQDLIGENGLPNFKVKPITNNINNNNINDNNINNNNINDNNINNNNINDNHINNNNLNDNNIGFYIKIGGNNFNNENMEKKINSNYFSPDYDQENKFDFFDGDFNYNDKATHIVVVKSDGNISSSCDENFNNVENISNYVEHFPNIDSPIDLITNGHGFKSLPNEYSSQSTFSSSSSPPLSKPIAPIALFNLVPINPPLQQQIALSSPPPSSTPLKLQNDLLPTSNANQQILTGNSKSATTNVNSAAIISTTTTNTATSTTIKKTKQMTKVFGKNNVLYTSHKNIHETDINTINTANTTDVSITSTKAIYTAKSRDKATAIETSNTSAINLAEVAAVSTADSVRKRKRVKMDERSRKLSRQESNRKAAEKYRIRKKVEQEIADKKFEHLTKKNDDCTNELEMIRDHVKQFLSKTQPSLLSPSSSPLPPSVPTYDMYEGLANSFRRADKFLESQKN